MQLLTLFTFSRSSARGLLRSRRRPRCRSPAACSSKSSRGWRCATRLPAAKPRHHSHGRHRAERSAPRAREAQFSRQVQSRRNRGAPRERARRAGRRVRARRRRQSADRPHALCRHHHDTAGRVRQSARVCGAQLQAARVPRRRPHRRQRRQSGRAAARRGRR